METKISWLPTSTTKIKEARRRYLCHLSHWLSVIILDVFTHKHTGGTKKGIKRVRRIEGLLFASRGPTTLSPLF